MIAIYPGKILQAGSQPQPSLVADFVDHYYRSTDVEIEGNVVTRLNSVKGGVNVPYVGLDTPTLERPYLNKNEVVFTNQPNANFKQLVRQDGNPFALPEEITIVFRKMPGTDFEALLSGWGNYYVGFGSTSQLRALNSDTYYSTPISLPYFSLNYLHLRYEGGATGICRAWLNGEYIGQVTANTWVRRQGYGVGIETNSTDFNWLASMFIERGMTDTERQGYFSAIEEEFNIGSILDLPYANNLTVGTSGGNHVANYTYVGSQPQNTELTEYRWYKLNPNLGSQQLISTSATVPAQSGVKVCVKVCDNQGRSWMFISSKYNSGL